MLAGLVIMLSTPVKETKPQIPVPVVKGDRIVKLKPHSNTPYTIIKH